MKIISKILEKYQRIPIPINPDPRHPCPFHGFWASKLGDIIIEQGGDQCALSTGHRSCDMINAGKNPNIEECMLSHYDKKNFTGGARKYTRVFVEEFRPIGCLDWEGLPFNFWFDYVMNSAPHPKATASTSPELDCCGCSNCQLAWEKDPCELSEERAKQGIKEPCNKWQKLEHRCQTPGFNPKYHVCPACGHERIFKQEIL